jgi:Sec-independent protein translocase protein TatA
MCLLATALTVSATGLALAQANQPPPSGAATAPPAPAVQQTPAVPPPSAPALPPQPPPVEKRGFLNDFGRWWDESIAKFKTKMKEQQSQLDEFNKKSSDAAKDAAAATQQAMKNAADAMRPSKMIEVHEVCAIAGNGAADCQAAATNACKSKGFSAGQPLDVRTAEKCNASLWVSGQNPASGACPVETVVLRAACQ